MLEMKLALIGIFLPLFPQSIIFNAIFQRLSHPLERIVLMMWPLIGLYLLSDSQQSLPDWIVVWALATALLYGFRLLTIRDMGLWVNFLAISVWSLLWIPVGVDAGNDVLYWFALGFSLPLMVLVVVIFHITSRFGAAYTDLYGGLAMTTPRLAGVMVIAVLAATATPVFPTFFIMLYAIVHATPAMVMSMLLVWLLWGWASARLLQGIIVGPVAGESIQDIAARVGWAYGVVFIAFAIAGIYVTGDLL